MSGTHNAQQCLERLEFRGLVASKLRHLHNQEGVFLQSDIHSLLAGRLGKCRLQPEPKRKMEKDQQGEGEVGGG